MPVLFGKRLSKQEYLRKVGDIDQCFGLRPVEYTSGKAAMIRACDVDLASGLHFSVNESKNLDMFKFVYKGLSYGFVTKASLSSPWICDEQGMAYRNNLGAGFLYTCGLSNVGEGCQEDGFYHYVHGNLKNIPARNVCRETIWDGDDCDVRIAGEVRDAAFFGRNLLLHREYRARIGEKRIFIEDRFENQGFAPEQLMLLYHLNLGYPILDEGTELIAPVEREEALSEHTRRNDVNYARMIPPIDNNTEYLHALTLRSDADGRTLVAAYNESLGLGLYVRYNTDLMRYLIEWKCMSSGDYALGVLPASCKPLGRAADRASGEMRTIAPGEVLHAKLEIGVIDGAAELDAIRSEINRL